MDLNWTKNQEGTFKSPEMHLISAKNRSKIDLNSTQNDRNMDFVKGPKTEI